MRNTYPTPLRPQATSAAAPRIEIPLNLENWAHLEPSAQELLTWFHQHVLDTRLSWDAARAALGFDSEDEKANEQIHGLIKGLLPTADLPEMLRRVEDYQKIALERGGAHSAIFVETPVSKLIWAGLDYALDNGTMVQIRGDSGHGKTISGHAWLETRAPGRGVFVEVPTLGGTRGLLAEVCASIGFRNTTGVRKMQEAIFRAFNPWRILLLDECTRLLPKDSRSVPEKIEFVRELHDRTGAAVGMFITQRFDDELEDSNYVYEQVLGRSMPIRLPDVLEEETWRPIVVQFFPRPSKELLTTCEQLANNRLPRQRGRLRSIERVFELANRMVSKERKTNPKARLTEAHFFKALAVRQKMMNQPTADA